MSLPESPSLRRWAVVLLPGLALYFAPLPVLAPEGRHLLVSEGRGARCEVVLNGTLKDLSRDLGLTHEVLYRTLAAMEREGVIERGAGVLRLVQ